MPSYRDEYKSSGRIPSGIEDDDPDGAFVFFGANPSWTPDREGQRAASLPPVGKILRHAEETCPTCGAAVGLEYLTDGRQTCAGCLRAADPRADHRFMAAIVAEWCREEYREELRRREAEAESFAARHHGRDDP